MGKWNFIDEGTDGLIHLTKNTGETVAIQKSDLAAAVAKEFDITPTTASQIVNNMGTEAARVLADQPSRAVEEVASAPANTAKWGAGAVGVGTAGVIAHDFMQNREERLNQQTLKELENVLSNPNISEERKRQILARLGDGGGGTPDSGGGLPKWIRENTPGAGDLPFGLDMPILLIGLFVLAIILKRGNTNVVVPGKGKGGGRK